MCICMQDVLALREDEGPLRKSSSLTNLHLVAGVESSSNLQKSLSVSNVMAASNTSLSLKQALPEKQYDEVARGVSMILNL